MSSWLCILNRENFKTVRERKVWGVAPRHRRQQAKAKPGDKCAFYLVGESFDHELKVPAIGGIFEVISEMYEDHSDIFPSKQSDDAYPYRLN
jgi:predicted RNA-binding protein